jgi:hypothetical protein
MDGQMKNFLEQLFIVNWPRKLISIIAAVIIWILVNNSITITRTLPNIPVKIIGLPADKTVEGLLPSGIMSNRVALTLTGSKNVLKDLTTSDLEVVIDARDEGDQWIAYIDKKSLVSLNPDIDLARNISEVTGNDFIVTLTHLVTEKIPIDVIKPIGDPPPGYQFLDVWPQRLFQTVSGPEEQVKDLKNKGIELTLDLSEISATQLNLIESTKGSHKQDEISFIVPESWKRVAIPFQNEAFQPINDPDAEHLRIDFLRKEFLPLDEPLPVNIFYPLKNASTINPEKYSLAIGTPIKENNGIFFLTTTLYVRDVSHLFLDVVKDNLEIVIVADPPENEAESLPWSVQFVNPKALENTYVELASAELNDKRMQELEPQLRENYLRNRFRNYMRQLELFIAPDKILQLDIKVKDDTLVVKKVSNA